jgi:uridine kinase
MTHIRLPISDIIARWSRSLHEGVAFLVGIDGSGGSGKSTLARAIHALLPGSVIIQMDDFYRPSSERQAMALLLSKAIGADFDWERVRQQVLEPLRQGTNGRYQRYDWNRDTLAEWHDVPLESVVLVEGTYSTRRELASFYDYRIFVDCPREVRLARGLQRDGEGARHLWENEWMPAEELYVEKHSPFRTADLRIDGSGLTLHDASLECIAYNSSC